MLLAASGLEGIAAGLRVFQLPSMEKNAALFGYSAARLLAGGSVILLSVILLIIFVLLFSNRATCEKWLQWLAAKQIPSTRAFLNQSLLLLSVSLSAISGLVLLFYTTVDPVFPRLLVYLERMDLAAVWLALLPLHYWGILAHAYTMMDARISLKEAGLYRYLLMLAMLVFSATQWMTLISRSQWVTWTGCWWRDYSLKKLTPGAFLFPALLAAGMLLISWLIRTRPPLLRVFTLLFLMGASLQAGYGYAQEGGFEQFRYQYSTSSFREEMEVICDYPGTAVQAIRDYEPVFGDSFWFETKPPGLAAVYLAEKSLLAVFRPEIQTDPDTCYQAMTGLLAYGAPWFTFIVLIPVFLLAKRLIEEENVPAAGILYIVLPNVLVMVMMRDQYLFPLLSALVSLAVYTMLQVRSTLTGLLAGGSLYVAVFTSFSLLPMIGFVSIWIGLMFIGEKGWLRLSRWLPMLSGFVLGFGTCWVGMQGLLGYDFLHRYQAAFWSHRVIKSYEFSATHLLLYAFQNVLEFGLWTGIPVSLLIISGTLKGAAGLIKGKVTGFNTFAAAFLLMYFALQIVGQTRGEVGRLWIFLLPAGMILAAPEALRLTARPQRGLLLVSALQLITADLMFLVMYWH